MVQFFMNRYLALPTTKLGSTQSRQSRKPAHLLEYIFCIHLAVILRLPPRVWRLRRADRTTKRAGVIVEEASDSSQSDLSSAQSWYWNSHSNRRWKYDKGLTEAKGLDKICPISVHTQPSQLRAHSLAVAALVVGFSAPAELKLV